MLIKFDHILRGYFKVANKKTNSVFLTGTANFFTDYFA